MKKYSFFIFCKSSGLRLVYENTRLKHFEVSGSFSIECHKLVAYNMLIYWTWGMCFFTVLILKMEV